MRRFLIWLLPWFYRCYEGGTKHRWNRLDNAHKRCLSCGYMREK